MIVNYIRPTGRDGPKLTTFLIVVTLSVLAMATGLYAGSSGGINQPGILPDVVVVGSKTIAPEVSGEDMIVNLLFHTGQVDGESGVNDREVVKAVVDALNSFYGPRGVIFQYEISAMNFSEMTDSENPGRANDRATVTERSPESWYNVYLGDPGRIQLGGDDQSIESNYIAINFGKAASPDWLQLVRDLGRSIALWHTVNNSVRLSESGDDPPESAWIVGDIDGNGQGPDVADLVYMADFMFRGGPKPTILQTADVAGTVGIVDIADLTHLVEQLFQPDSGSTRIQ